MIPADAVTNQIVRHMDWPPTFLAAAGESDIKDKLLKCDVKAIGRTYKVHHTDAEHKYAYDSRLRSTGSTKRSRRRRLRTGLLRT